MLSDAQIQALAGRLLSQDLSLTRLADGSGVLLDLSGQQILALNETALHLLEALRATPGATREGLLLGITSAFEVSHETAGSDLERFLDRLDEVLAHRA